MSDIVILEEEKYSKESERNFDMSNEDFSENKPFLEKMNDYLLKIQSIWIKEKVVFYRLLSTMLNAWMSLVKGVWVLEKQEKNKVFKTMLGEFIKELKEWKTLSDCLDMWPRSFWTAEIWVIKSWEKTWKLNEVLTSLADQIEKVSSISWKLKSAMMYPAMIMLVVFWVIFIMMTMVVPKLLEIFSSKDALPPSTQLLILLSDFFRNYWYLIILGVIATYWSITMWKKTPTWKYMFDKLILKIPVLGSVMEKVILSKFSRVFSWLISSWVSIVESLKIVADAVWNEVYRQRILLLMEDVKWWMKIWESLEWDKLFPDMMIQMIQVWEQAAKLDKTIIKVADFYDEQVDNTVWIINKLLEPFIIVFLAVVVWFIAIAIMQPIMNMSDSISNS